jgi:hypothetical protein
MRTITETKEIYTFNELDDNAKEAALDQQREWTYSDSDFVSESIQENFSEYLAGEYGLKLFGHVWYDCDRGDFAYTDSGSLEIGDWQALAKKAGVKDSKALVLIQAYGLTTFTTNISTETTKLEACGLHQIKQPQLENRLDSVIEDLAECVSDFFSECIRSARAEWEYQISDEALIEQIEANEYEFTKEGKVY